MLDTPKTPAQKLNVKLRQARTVRPSLPFLWRELVVRKQQVCGYTTRSGRLCVKIRHRTADTSGLTEVFVGGNYDFPLEVRESLAGLSHVRALDLGANIGLFGLKLFEQIPTAELVGFEPDPDNAAIHLATVRANKLDDRWRLVQACAMNFDGEVRFATGNYKASKVDKEGAPLPAVDVLPRILDSDLLKIDIEGSEWALITDPRFRQTQARALFLEYHPPHRRDAVVSAVVDAGFRPLPFTERTPGFGEFWAVRS